MFVKGKSGNPGGRPKLDVGQKIARDLAREHTKLAVDTLVKHCTAKKTPPAVQVSAATEILNRGWGRAPQTVDIVPHSPIDDLSTDQLLTLATALGGVVARGLEGDAGTGSEGAAGAEAGPLSALSEATRIPRGRPH